MSHNITDEELDRDWQPNGRRPQSTIARSFSAELMDIFRIENSVADMDEKLHERKNNVQSHQTELESLERRIREMENRLKGGSGASNAQRPPIQTQDAPGAAAASNSAPAPPAKDAPAPPEKSKSRPGTARQNQPNAPSSANMPPTPTASEGEYDFVGKDDLDDGPAPSSTQP